MVFCNSPYLLVRDVSKNVMRTVSKGKAEKVETLLNICATLRKATHPPSSIFFLSWCQRKKHNTKAVWKLFISFANDLIHLLSGDEENQ